MGTMGKNYVSWRRVSTFKQNRSGLGLEAQAEIIKFFVERDGGILIADYSECYTGTELSGCVELRKAMALAKRENAILVIAKSDRFRNCQEALGILNEMGEGNIEFCDLPHSDRFTLTLFWALAEREALITSIRTKQALAAKKARGEAVGAQAEKYKMTMANKCPAEIKSAHAKKGVTRNLRYLESRETQALIKCLKNTFPEATDHPNIAMWEWDKLNTKYDSRERFLRYMQDFKSVDPTLFPKWDLKGGDIQQRMANFIMVLRKSAMTMNERESNTKY